MNRCIRDVEPSTSCVQRNIYHMHVPLFVLDVVRLLQNHPKYCNGLKECDIVELAEKNTFANGDVAAQVKSALKELTVRGFVRYMHQGYRTLGPFAKLAQARTPRQFDIVWNRLAEVQKLSSTSLSSCSSRSTN